MVKLQKVWLSEIEVGARLRPLDTVAVGLLAKSIEQMGLQTPISVRVVEDDRGETPVLIAGYHRLMAMRQLGHETAMCAVHDGNESDARLWEIAENLHRAELSVQERAEHIAEWVRITDRVVSAQVARKPKGGRPEGGLSAAVRELGIDRTEAQRAVKIAAIAPEAKQAAADAGMSDNQAALLRVAKEANPAQTPSVSDEASRRILFGQDKGVIK